RLRYATEVEVGLAPSGWSVTVQGPPGPSLELVRPAMGIVETPPAPVRRAALDGSIWPGVGVSGGSAQVTLEQLRALGTAAEHRREGRPYAAELSDPSPATFVGFVRRLGRG